RLSSRLHSDVDRMGRTVALNANAAVRSTAKTFLMLRVMLGLQVLKDQTQECHAQNKDLTSQTISGIRTVRSFNAEKEELRRYHVALEELCAIKRRSGIYSAVYLLIRREIMYCYGETMSTVGVISKVLSYLDRTPKSKEEGDLAPKTLDGEIVMQNIHFSYPSAPSDKPALKSISLQIHSGKITALVGPSGGGKSSCVSLLKMLYEPQEGQILLDGKPLHCSIGFPESCALFGFPEVQHRIWPGETPSGGEGERKGQKQSLAIIRALLRDPQVIILDEATSKLDVDAEKAVLNEVLARKRTVLIVTHQLRIVEKADHIIFMEDGLVREEGTHQELMNKKGGYFRLKEELGIHVDSPPVIPTLTTSYVHGTSSTSLLHDTVAEALQKTVERWPDREAVAFLQNGVRKTFAEFQQDVSLFHKCPCIQKSKS
ncbi:hypothetical protein GOODEAATRI_014089, partial [Goodea atripinnis]